MAADPITVLLVENQSLTRIGVRAVLAATEDINLVGEAAAAAEGLDMFRNLRPDVAILLRKARLPQIRRLDDVIVDGDRLDVSGQHSEPFS